MMSERRVNWNSYFGSKCCKMDNIEDVRIEPCTKSKFVQPFRVLYKQVSTHVYVLCTLARFFLILPQNGKEALWDCVKMHDR